MSNAYRYSCPYFALRFVRSTTPTYQTLEAHCTDIGKVGLWSIMIITGRTCIHIYIGAPRYPSKGSELRWLKGGHVQAALASQNHFRRVRLHDGILYSLPPTTILPPLHTSCPMNYSAVASMNTYMDVNCASGNTTVLIVLFVSHRR